jgi:hypothetical protein
MKKLILLGALIAPFFVSSQTIYDTTESVNPTDSNEVLFDVSGSGFVYVRSSICGVLLSGGTQTTRYENCAIVAQNATATALEYDRVTYVRNQQTNNFERGAVSRLSYTSMGQEMPVSVCDTPSYTYRRNNLCYSPAALAANDTCDTSNLFQALTTEDNICSTKQDGSQCRSERVLTVLFSPIDNDTGFCYNNAVDDEITVPPLPEPDTCNLGSSDFLICATDGSTNNGFDQDRYCGSYNTGSGNTEVCFDKDQDSDNIPNSTDDDIDGDGLLNTADPDHDNDGIANAEDTDYTPSTTGGGTGGGGDTGDGTGTGGGGGGGISGSIGDLIEQVDINSDDGIAGLQVIGTGFNTSIDEFLANENLDMIETINSNNVSSSMDTLKNIVTPTACSLSFTAPFRGGMTIELCPYVEPLKPILAIFFAVGTFIYGFRRIFETIRGAQ